MKWAFEYACKICEEQLPNTLPLNIHEKNGKRVIAALKIRNYATLPRSIHNPAEPHTVMPIAARQRTACAIPQGKYGVFGQQTRRFCIVNTAYLHCKHGEFTLQTRRIYSSTCCKREVILLSEGYPKAVKGMTCRCMFFFKHHSLPSKKTCLNP